MKARQRWLSGLVVSLMMAAFLATLLRPLPVVSDGYCEMARDVAVKAAQTFSKDKAKGVKLFIKALSLCDKPLYQYNLGIAYYRYVKGEHGQAEVFVYYVGHGAPAEKGGEAYLVPVDAEVDYIETSGYPLSVFYRNLELLPAKSVMVVLDA